MQIRGVRCFNKVGAPTPRMMISSPRNDNRPAGRFNEAGAFRPRMMGASYHYDCARNFYALASGRHNGVRLTHVGPDIPFLTCQTANPFSLLSIRERSRGNSLRRSARETAGDDAQGLRADHTIIA